MAKYMVLRTDGKLVPDDEPCFVVRGQDINAVPTMLKYMSTVDAYGDAELFLELAKHLVRLVEWQIENKDKVKYPD